MDTTPRHFGFTRSDTPNENAAPFGGAPFYRGTNEMPATSEPSSSENESAPS